MMVHIRATTLLAGLLVGGAAAACEKPMIDVYQSPSPECRSGWAEYLSDNGFEVTTRDIAAFPVDRLRAGAGTAAVCQRALVDGYVIEGDVPASAIIRLLEERPRARGLSVTQPPAGPAPAGVQTASRNVVLVELDGSIRAYTPNR